jgi:UDP-N-acetylmuramate--alanine ligase
VNTVRSPGADPAASRALALANAALDRPHSPFSTLPARLAVVDVDRQRLVLLREGYPAVEYPVSTAAAGVGGEENSFKTPPGWHRIHRKLGAGEPTGARFVSREPTGEVWRGEARDEDMILTRVLTLEGLEEGVNRGPGRDSLERYIYLHGTNHEDHLGRPDSHGCVRMANADVIDLFDRLEVGDPIVIVGEPSAFPDPRGPARFHYAGLGGSGMSALAQFQAMLGGRASGSDRAFDRGERADTRARLEHAGVTIHPQDGRGVTQDIGALVVSTAVEDQVPDVRAARELGIPIVHRSELLAHFVATHRTIAVSGTSGKSTVVAMIFDLLSGAGLDPSVITGGDLARLRAEGLVGNAWHGRSDLLVVEADESDGSLVRYSPSVGVVLNLEKDHKAIAEVAAMFSTFRSRTRDVFIAGEGEHLAPLAAGARTFGFGPRADVAGTDVELDPDGSRFRVKGVPFTLAVPGRHNVENALAAIASALAVGVPLERMVEPLEGFRGVERRFQVLGTARGVEVVDDFAHNPSKIAATVATARRRAAARAGGRVLAIYQPHGYGPTRFLRPDFVETFARELEPSDRMWMLEVFYAGGTATRDFSAAEIVAEIAARGASAEFAPSREWLIERVAGEAREGDIVLVMGARDPSLTDLAKAILAAIGAGAGARSVEGKA